MRLDFSDQKRALIASSCFTIVPVLLLLFVIGLLGLMGVVRPGKLMVDSAAAAGVPFYYGALSMVGLFMWCGATTVCLFTHWVLRKTGRDSQAKGFFLWCGTLGLLLLIDDAYMIHELVGRVYWGIPSVVFFLTYAFMAIAIATLHWNFLQQTYFLLILAAFALFSASVLVDLAQDSFSIDFDGMLFVEDSFKLLGIAAWLSYFVATAGRQLNVSNGLVEDQIS